MHKCCSFFFFGKCFNTLHRVSFGYYPQSLASYCCHNLNNDCFFSSYFSPLQETVLFLHSEPTDFVLNECFSDKYVTRHSFLDVAVFNTRTPTETPIKKILLSKISCRKSYFRPCQSQSFSISPRRIRDWFPIAGRERKITVHALSLSLSHLLTHLLLSFRQINSHCPLDYLFPNQFCEYIALAQLDYRPDIILIPEAISKLTFKRKQKNSMKKKEFLSAFWGNF